MAYRHVAVFELDGNFVGYSIIEDGAHKLQSTHLYAEDDGYELTSRLSELNDSQTVRAAWPDAHDPEVQALVADATFEPIEMVSDEIIDEGNSYIAYLKDADGEDTFEIDHEASVLKYQIAEVPARPSDYMARTKKACEVVARRRSS